MNRKRIGGIIAGVIAIPVLVIAGFAIYLLGQAHDLPWQTQPTAISRAVTPFANLGGTTPPTTAATTVATPSSTAGVPGTATASSAPAASPTAASTTASGTSSASATTAPAGSAAAAKAPGGATTYNIVGDQSEAKVTVN